MFDWLFKKTPEPKKPEPLAPARILQRPVLSRGNPGKGYEIEIASSRGNKTWSESLNLVTTLSRVLAEAGHPHQVKESSIELEAGLILQPLLVDFQPLEPNGARTLSTIEVTHPEMGSVFEYQHSNGDNYEQSVAKGFIAWKDVDLPVFLDALQPEPKVCLFVEMELPATETSPKRHRRVVLGPVSFYAAQPAENEEHTFCPCCIFTRCAPSMNPVVNADTFFALRVFAMRGADGTRSADCRLNGEDWEEGKQMLLDYLETWPNRGFEFRKQYIIVGNQSTSSVKSQ